MGISSTIGLAQRFMKRILHSAIGGVVLTVAYFILFWLVATLVRVINGDVWGDSFWFWLLSLPLEGGGRLYTFLFPPGTETPYALLKPGAIVADLVVSFILFGVLTYVTLFLRRNRPSTEVLR